MTQRASTSTHKPRREARIAHEWRAAQYHTHERVIERNGFRVVSVRCTKPNCRKDGDR